jgi:hypothetical protein
MTIFHLCTGYITATCKTVSEWWIGRAVEGSARGQKLKSHLKLNFESRRETSKCVSHDNKQPGPSFKTYILSLHFDITIQVIKPLDCDVRSSSRLVLYLNNGS